MQKKLKTLDVVLGSLNVQVDRQGRIGVQDLETLVSRCREINKCSPTQALLILRCFGNILVDVEPSERTPKALDFWKFLEDSECELNPSHYNCLLKVHLENEHTFSPADFLSWMESKGVAANRITFQNLIVKFCQTGDCLLYTSPSPRDRQKSRMPSSA